MSRMVIRWKQALQKIFTKRMIAGAIFALCLIFVGSFVMSHFVFAAEPAAPTPSAVAPAGPGVMENILLWLADIAVSFAVVLSKLVIMILELLIPVMTYNDFANNPVVDSGWAILRDTVNMFYVVILIVIAFGTIFGSKRFQWQQQLVNILKSAVIINFSRTICGLIIDAGQVVMLTFVNAIREIAAGNFVQMFGMGDVYSLSSKSSTFQDAATNAGGQAAKAFDYFASGIASVFMMVAVLCIMIMFLLFLLYRIVMLWILISLSPFAWFLGTGALGGVGDVVKSNAYSDWWAQFKCLVAAGPVLSFFLWLTLVVAGSGNASAGFDTGSATTASTAGGFLTSIFEMPKLISFVVALALMWAGFDATSKVCTAMPGIGNPGAFIKGGATKIARTGAGIGARVGARVARTGWKGAKAVGGTVARETGMADQWSKAKEKLYRETAQRAGTGAVGKVIARKSTAAAEQIAAERAAQMSSRMEPFKNESADSKNDTLRRMAESGAITRKGKEEEMALMLDAMGDDKRMKDLRASGTWDEMWKRHGKDIEDTAKGDKNMKAKVDAHKKQNVDIAGNWEDVKNQEDASRLSAFALSDPKAKDRLKNVDTKFKRTKAELAEARKNDPNASEFLSMDEAIRTGKFFGKDDDRTKAYTQGRGAIYEGMKPEDLGRIPANVLANNITVGLLDKNVGSADGPKVGAELLGSKDVRVQVALHKKLNDPSTDPKMREGLLAGAGMKDGKVEDSAKFLATLTNNPGALSYLDDKSFAGLDDDRMIELGSAFADTNVLKSAIANYRKDSSYDSSPRLALNRIQGILEKNPTPEMIAAQGYLKAQRQAVGESRTEKIATDVIDRVKAVQGKVKERMNEAIDTSAINAVVANIGQILDLRQQVQEADELVEKTPPTDPNMRAVLERSSALRNRLDAVKADANQQVTNIANSDVLSQQLDDEIANQMGKLASLEAVTGAKDGPVGYFERRSLQNKLAQLNNVKTLVAEVKAQTAAEKKTP